MFILLTYQQMFLYTRPSNSFIDPSYRYVWQTYYKQDNIALSRGNCQKFEKYYQFDEKFVSMFKFIAIHMAFTINKCIEIANLGKYESFLCEMPVNEICGTLNGTD